jgi:molybdopterin converting factor small subunit
MAIFYPPFKLSEKIGKKRVEIDAPTLQALIVEGSKVFEVDLAETAKHFSVLINGRNIRYLEGFSTPLAKDDEVWFVHGSGGG